MESADKQSIIVEFNGLPGTGKSTITKELAKLLLENNIECRYEYYRNYFQRFRVSALGSISCLRLRNIIHRYADSVGVRRDKNRDYIIMQLYRMYKDFLNTKGMILLKDQGLIQSLLSISHLNTIDNNQIIRDIPLFLRNNNVYFLRVDCQSDLKVTKNRIINRPTQNARLDNISEKKLLDALKTQNDNLNAILSSFDETNYDDKMVIHINTENTPEENAEKILEQIKYIINSN